MAIKKSTATTEPKPDGAENKTVAVSKVRKKRATRKKTVKKAASQVRKKASNKTALQETTTPTTKAPATVDVIKPAPSKEAIPLLEKEQTKTSISQPVPNINESTEQTIAPMQSLLVQNLNLLRDKPVNKSNIAAEKTKDAPVNKTTLVDRKQQSDFISSLSASPWLSAAREIPKNKGANTDLGTTQKAEDFKSKETEPVSTKETKPAEHDIIDTKPAEFIGADPVSKMVETELDDSSQGSDVNKKNDKTASSKANSVAPYKNSDEEMSAKKNYGNISKQPADKIKNAQLAFLQMQMQKKKPASRRGISLPVYKTTSNTNNEYAVAIVKKANNKESWNDCYAQFLQSKAGKVSLEKMNKTTIVEDSRESETTKVEMPVSSIIPSIVDHEQHDFEEYNDSAAMAEADDIAISEITILENCDHLFTDQCHIDDVAVTATPVIYLNNFEEKTDMSTTVKEEIETNSEDLSDNKSGFDAALESVNQNRGNGKAKIDLNDIRAELKEVNNDLSDATISSANTVHSSDAEVEKVKSNSNKASEWYNMATAYLGETKEKVSEKILAAKTKEKIVKEAKEVEIEDLFSGLAGVACTGWKGVATLGKYTKIGVQEGAKDSKNLISSAVAKIKS